MTKPLFLILVIIAAALAIYWPARHGDWLWDDDLLVASNARLHSLAGLGKIWFAAPPNDYWPLTWTLLWIEWHLWGNAPLGYHLASVALHICGGLLLWRVLGRLGLRHGWIGGLLFVVHPLAVESVAWVSEIKNTLSLPLFLLAFDAWLDAEDGRPSGLARSVVFYLLAMLAKTSTVTLPLVILLHCWWKRGRVTRLELQRITPHLAIALVLGVVTMHFQNHTHNTPIEPDGFISQLLVAGTALFFYLGKFLLPLDLTPIYPPWSLDPPSLLFVLTLPALAILLLLLWLVRKTWGRHALFGFGFFLITVAPILGFVKMDYLHFSPVADHLVYLPMLGLVGLVAALAEGVAAKIPASFHYAALGVLAMVFAALAWTSHGYAGLYADKQVFWTYTLQQNPFAWPAYEGLGNADMDRGKLAESIHLIESALKIKPDYAEGHYDLGNAEFRLGHLPEAITEYEQAVQLNPRDAQTHYNLANTLMRADRVPEAITQYEQALARSPDISEYHDNLGNALMHAGRAAEAIAQYAQAVDLDPGHAEAFYNLGSALLQTGRAAEAIAPLEQALRLNPAFVEAHANLGVAYEKTGRTADAIAQFQEALRLKPDFAPARANLERLQSAPTTP